jgi:hypothetical protein
VTGGPCSVLEKVNQTLQMRTDCEIRGVRLCWTMVRARTQRLCLHQ